MKTIVVANQKGGSGKSTLTVHLAAAAEAAGNGPVIITDTDPQGSAGDWFNQRKKSGIDTPRYTSLTLASFRQKLVPWMPLARPTCLLTLRLLLAL